jgi:hypothetical protein
MAMAFKSSFHGGVFDPAGQPIVLNVSGEITATRNFDGSFGFTGWFMMAAGISLTHKGQYELRLDDGTKAPMLVLGIVQSTGSDTKIEFQLLDALK